MPARRARPLLRHTEVPPRVRESFILSGYRSPDYSLADCLRSALRPTNETGNFWSHFLPLFLFLHRFLEVFGWEGAPPGQAPFFYPLWTYFLGVACMLLGSSLAHLLNAMSLVAREVCFFLDYGAIGAYTVGSSLAYFYYIHPRAGLLDQDRAQDSTIFFESFYIPSACAVALVCVLSCSLTRQRWRRHRYLIRTLVFLLPLLVSSAPVFYRLLTRSPYPAGSASFAASAPSSAYFWRHCLWLLASAVFNVSKLPERLAPGRFDVWGHSHQWFHCCTFLSILNELHMIKAEVRAMLLSPALLRHPARLPGPRAASTYGVMLLLQGAILAVILWFSWRASRTYGSQREPLVQRRRRKAK